MKKYVTIVVLLLVCQAGMGQSSVSQLFNDFSKVDNSVKVSLGKFTMSIASIFSDTMGVDGIEVYDFDECSSEIKEKFSNAARNLKDSEYDTLINNNEDGSRTKVLVKIKDEMIREMVVVTTGDSNALIRIKGKIKPSDIERVAQKHNGNGR